MRILGFAKNAFLWHYLRMLHSSIKTTKHPRRPKRDSLLNYVEELQARGRLVFTSAEAMKNLKETPNAFIKASLALIRDHKLFRPANGFYVIIPAEYRNAKSVPAEWYIDALMKFYGQPYYVGGLSAAALHGAAHQAPQELQVVTTNALRPINKHRTRIRFLTKKDLSETPIQEIKTHTGYFKVSTPEATAFDLVKYYRWVGYINNVATVLTEISEQVDPKKLLSIAEAESDLANTQRLGYLLDRFAKKTSATELHKWLKNIDTKFVPLRPGWDGELLARDEKWRILVNDDVEADQ